MYLWADKDVTKEESEVIVDAPFVEVHVLEHNHKRFYLVFDQEEDPAVYSSLEAMVADNYGQA